MGSPKLLFIGIDGAPLELVRHLAAKGELPNLTRLMEGGASGVLNSLVDNTPPAWSSIYTGKNPGKHGVYDFMRRKKGSHEFTHVNSTSRHSEDFWETLSRRGLKVGVLNAPLAYPVRKVNGFLVSGFLTPGPESAYTFPLALKGELESAVPGFRPSSPAEFKLHLSRQRYLSDILRNVENLRKGALHLIRNGEYDFFGVVVSETDFVQHSFWADMEKGGSNYSEAIPATYRAVDRMVGDLLAELGPDAHVMVVSDHGGIRRREVFRTNQFLNSIGALAFKKSPSTRLRKLLSDIGVTSSVLGLLYRGRLFVLKFFLRPLMLSLSDVDWPGTLAYSQGYGQIYLNIKGRESQGALPSEGARETTESIVRKLKSVRGRDGLPIVSAAYDKGDIFSGPYVDDGPDIQFVTADGYEPDRLFTEEVDRSGTHTTRGMVILSGKGVKPGEEISATVVDVAPTILGLMGTPIPSDVDGRFISGAFTQGFLHEHELEFTAVQASTSQEEYELNRSETSTIEEHLRSLGYI